VFYVAEYLKTLERRNLFGSGFPIPGLREPKLKVTEDYVLLAGFPANEDVDTPPDEEDVA
jgi:hypothetical protein